MTEHEQNERQKSQGLNRAVHLQAASQEHDYPERDAAIASAILGVSYVAVVMYVELNHHFVTTNNVDEVFFGLIIAALVPWFRLLIQAFANIERVGAKKAALVWALESAIERDIDGDNIIGQPYPENWLSDYYSELVTRRVSSSKEQAAKLGLSYAQWQAARDVLIATGLAVTVGGGRKGQRAFIPAKLSLAEIARRMPETAPDITPYVQANENGSKLQSEEQIRKRARTK